MPHIRLFSARACPFAHRTRLVLAHKSIPFELVEIDLQNKPIWFDRTLSGYGKVPALEHGETRIWESAIINEYLDETFRDPPLLPAEPSARARARIWIDYANTRFAPAFTKLLRAPDAGDRERGRAELVESLEHIERGFEQHGGEGPYFLGAEPSLVDFALYPWFERWTALEHYRGPILTAQHERIARFRGQLAQLRAVQDQAETDEFYVQRYASVAVRAPKVA